MHTSISENTHGAGTRHLLQIWVSVYVYSVILYMCVHTCALSFTCFDDFWKARGTGFYPLNEIDNLPWVCCCWRVVLAVLHTAFGKKKYWVTCRISENKIDIKRLWAENLQGVPHTWWQKKMEAPHGFLFIFPSSELAPGISPLLNCGKGPSMACAVVASDHYQLYPSNYCGGNCKGILPTQMGNWAIRKRVLLTKVTGHLRNLNWRYLPYIRPI